MSLLVAQNQLISIIEAVTPVRKSRGLPSNFKHYPKAHRLALPDSRGFFFESGQRTVSDWMGKLSSSYLNKQQAVVITYKRDLDKLALEQAIDEDADAIMRALLNPSLWNRPTSTIIAIDAGEGMIASIEEESDTTLLLLSFNIEVTP